MDDWRSSRKRDKPIETLSLTKGLTDINRENACSTFLRLALSLPRTPLHLISVIQGFSAGLHNSVGP